MIVPTSAPTARKRSAAAKQVRVELRMKIWPQVPPEQLWDRKKEVGFTTLPRTLPIIMQILDGLTKNTPVGSTYLDLWCRANDEGYVKLDRSAEMAKSAGFLTDRGPGIWAKRMDLLHELGFINIATGPFGSRSFALIFNPYLVIDRLNGKGEVDAMLYACFIHQASAIGANFSGVPTGAPAVAAPSAPVPAAPPTSPANVEVDF